MTNFDHPGNDLLIQYLDGELSESQFMSVRSHLPSCVACKNRLDEFAQLSSGLQAAIAAGSIKNSLDSRTNLAKALASSSSAKRPARVSATVMRRFAWGMAAAALFALGILLAPRAQAPVKSQAGKTRQSELRQSGVTMAAIDVNGESFVALPYSNPDLPLNAPRIVEMQVPVSTLASAGIFVQSNGLADRTVPANVLLGMDGQPMGIHVLSVE